MKTRRNRVENFISNPNSRDSFAIVYIFIEIEIEVNPQRLGSINNHRGVLLLEKARTVLLARKERSN